MNVRAVLNSVHKIRLFTLRSVGSKSTDVAEPAEKELTKPKPQPGTLSNGELEFDEKTHTGQAWDQEDYRLVRFTYGEKHVNPNVAMTLINEIPPTAVKDSVVACDGGGGALGHPKVYINLDKPGNHGCGYCGLRFYKEGLPHDRTEHIQA